MNPHQSHKTSLIELFSSLSRNRQLITQMAKQEVLGRYRGSVMGLAWSFLNPVLMLIVYTFLFSVVFKAKWGVGQTESHADFAVILFAGLIVHGLFAECINRAPLLIHSNVSYVKKVVFPLETLPWIAMGSALFHAAISLIVLLGVQLVLGGGLPWTVVFFPLILAPLILMIMGFAWFLASTGVYLRDIAQTTGIATSVLLFVSPVFYPISSLPEKLQFFIFLNPLTLIIEQSRKVLIFGELPDWINLGIYSLVSMLVAWAGFWWFQKTRKGFADVL
jgi:lipopolysaccharide transport system permease protein